MALEGNLEELSIVALLQTIASAAMSGNLLVYDNTNKGTIYFFTGKIIHAESTMGGDRVGEILVRTHRITRQQLEKANYLQRHQQQGQRLGAILMEMKLISDQDLAMAIQVQIMEIMSRLLVWTRGQFKFTFERPLGSEMPSTALDLDEILSGQISLLEMSDPALDSDAILGEVLILVPGNQDDARVTLQGLDWTVLSAVDGRLTVAEIADRVGLDARQIRQVVADLISIGLVRKKAQTELPTEQEARGDPTLANIYREVERQEQQPQTINPSTMVLNPADLTNIEEVLDVLLTRSEASEVCLISADGNIISQRGQALHQNYPSLFALVAGIFSSWQELGRYLGESRPSTMVYHGKQVNTCLSPVTNVAILMTLYHQHSTTGLVSFWSKEAANLIARLISQSANQQQGADGLRRSNVVTLDFRAQAAQRLDNVLGSSDPGDPTLNTSKLAG